MSTVTVFIPTFNGERLIAEVIDAVLAQELPRGYELDLHIIDSGSTDRTVEIVQSYGDRIRFEQIPNSEFSHGATRQRAAMSSSGTFILFLTQDATPAHNRWLISMIEPFFLSDRIGCVVGAQIPRPHAAPAIKREVAEFFGALGGRNSIMIDRHRSFVDGKETNGLSAFFSNANSAVRLDLLNRDVPFRSVSYAEDQALAQDMQRAGYVKAYAPQGEVIHCNEYTAKEYYQRKFDEFIGLRESIGAQYPLGLRGLFFGWIRPTLDDYVFIMRDRSYSWREKLYWLYWAPQYNVARCRGQRDAWRFFGNRAKREKVSLEAATRRSTL